MTRSRQKQSRSVNVAHFHCARAILEMRMVEGQLDGFIVTGGFDGVVAAEDFFGLAVRAIGRFRPAALRADDAAGVLGQALAVFGERLLAPG